MLTSCFLWKQARHFFCVVGSRYVPLCKRTVAIDQKLLIPSQASPLSGMKRLLRKKQRFHAPISHRTIYTGTREREEWKESPPALMLSFVRSSTPTFQTRWGRCVITATITSMIDADCCNNACAMHLQELARQPFFLNSPFLFFPLLLRGWRGKNK